MIKEINAFETKMHEAGLKLVGDNSTRAAGNGNDDDPTAELSIFAEQVVHGLWDLYDNPFRYADGYINEVKPDGTFSVTGVSYPICGSRPSAMRTATARPAPTACRMGVSSA